MLSASRLTLDKVTIAGFRGYGAQKTIALAGKSAILLGPNMCGKSSTLGAIEWCLFGDFYSLPADKTRARDELVNDHSPSASVKLELTRAGKQIVVERVKQRGESKSKLKVTLDDGSVIQDPEASNRIFQILGLGFEDFVRSVYLHQENVRDILTEDRKVRSEAMDRLFGLEKLRNISDGMKPSIIKEALDELTRERDEVMREIEARFQEADRGVREAIATATKARLPKRSLTLTHAKELLTEAGAMLKEAAEGTDVTVPAPVGITEHADIDAACGSISSAVTTVRKHVPEDRLLKELNRRIADLESAYGEYNKARTSLANVDRGLKVFVKKHGGAKDIEHRVRMLGEKIDELELRREQMDAKGRLIQAGIKYLGEVTRLTKCPICESPVKQADLVEHLQEEAKTAVSKELKAIEERIAKTKEEREGAQATLEELTRLEETRKEASESVGKRIAELAKLLKKTLSVENADAEAKEELSRLQDQKGKLGAPIRERENKLTEITERVEQARAIAEVLKRQERLEELSQIRGWRELENVEAVIRELAALQVNVGLLGDKIRELQTELAKGLVAKSLPAIKRFYSELAGHPYFNGLEIEVQPDTRGGVVKNLYVVKGIAEDEKSESVASLKFSTGHMNCVGLSVFLALAHEGSYEHNVGFLILDDPSQNLDGKHKEALAKLLAKMQGKSQVIVATEDESFQSHLETSFKGDDVVRVRFAAWDVDGPKIKVIG